MIFMIENIDKTKCTGCKMCADICPKNAISFTEDSQGFWYPKVNAKCVNCGICIKKCPSLNEHVKGNQEPIVYSVWSLDENTRISSTSGGVFWEIALKFLEDGGVVVGCRYGKDWKSAEHIIARNKYELEQIKGSKYFQSDTAGIYKQVRNELEINKKVLFCGTPCQISALKAFLGKEYDNLYLMDFICRSINSPKAFKAYIDELENIHNSKVIKVHLKNKERGWQSLASQVLFENGDQSLKDKTEDWWVKGFIYNDLYTRESCYHCQYKVLPRLNSDITIGDFWGIKNQLPEDMFNGISVMLLNTKKGEYLFDICSSKFKYKQYTIEDVLPGNPALLKNPIKTKKQDEFFELLHKHTFSYSVKKCINVSRFGRLKSFIKKILKKIKKVVWVLFKSDIDLFKFVKYNFFSKNVVRTTKSRIIPHKNAVLDLQGDSKIILSGSRDLHIGINKLKGSNAETHIRLNDGAIWECKNGADLFYGTVIEVKNNANFSTGFFSANGGSVIITHKSIELGEDVMIGRNVIIYDSDFHTIFNQSGIPCNPPKKVKLEDHVWLTSNIIVQKGVTIGKGSLITAFTTVNKEVPPHSIYGGESVGKVIKNQVDWSRKICPLE